MIRFLCVPGCGDWIHMIECFGIEKISWDREVSELANIKSAKKRVEVAERNRMRNKSKNSEIKTYIKKFDAAVEANAPSDAQEILKVIDRKVKRASLGSAMSKNKADRTVSRLQKRLNELTNMAEAQAE